MAFDPAMIAELFGVQPGGTFVGSAPTIPMSPGGAYGGAYPTAGMGAGVAAPSAMLPAVQNPIVRQLMQQQQARLMAGQGQQAIGGAAQQQAIEGPASRALNAGMPNRGVMYSGPSGEPIPMGPSGGQIAGRGIAGPAGTLQLGAETPALGAGPGYSTLPSSGAAIPMGTGGSPAAAFSSPTGTGALGLTADEATGLSGLGARGGAAAAEGGGLLNQAKSLFGGGKDTLMATAEGGGVANIAKGIAGRGLKGGLPIYIGSQLAGDLVNHFAPKSGVLAGLGGQHGGGDAIKDMGSGAALGFTLAGPPGAVAGELIGGVKAIGSTLNELDDVGSYDQTATKFQKLNESKFYHGRPEREQFEKVAQEIHNDPKASIAQKNAALQKIVTQMGDFRAQTKAEKQSTHAGNRQIKMEAKNRAAAQILVANKMAEYGQQMVASGDAQAQGLQNAMGSVDPMYQPLLQAEAARASGFGRQMQSGYAAAALAQPMVDQMDAQVQQNQQAVQAMQLETARQRALAQQKTGSGTSLAQQLAGKK